MKFLNFKLKPSASGVPPRSDVDDVVEGSLSLATMPSSADDIYRSFVRQYLFPLLVARRRVVLALWVATFVLSVSFGLKFFSLPRSNFDLPKNTPSYEATQAYSKAYPNSNGWPPVFIVQSSLAAGASVLSGKAGESTRRVASALANFTSSGVAVERVSGYWELVAVPSLSLLAAEAVSPDNSTLLSSVIFRAGVTVDQINTAVSLLLPFVAGLSDEHVSVAATGLFALFDEMTTATKESFTSIDSAVLPIATIILGWRLRSYRHMAVSFAALGCTLLLAFAIMVPIAAPGVVDINPFAPSIMLSLGIAVTFDYSLFLLMRFREERIIMCKSKEDAVFHALMEAGHVIFISGSTLTATFLILVFFPANFLVSVGWACSVVVIAGMLTNLTLSPALLLYFDCLSHFDALPSRRSCCCRVPPEDPAVIAAATKLAVKSDVATVAAASSGAGASSSVSPWARVRARPLLAFARCVTGPKMRWAIVIAAALISVPFALAFQGLQPSSDDYLIYLLGSRSLNALGKMKKAFPEGELDPYYVLVDTGVPGSVYSAEYFAAESNVVSKLLETQPGFINNASVTALSYFRGKSVNFTDAMRMANFNASDASYDASPTAVAYRALAATLPSSTGAASVVKLVTLTSPRSLAIVAFIRSVRNLGAKLAAAAVPSGALAVRTYLVGGITTDVDVQDALYALVPLEIGVVVGLVLLVVAASFRALVIAVRLVVTIFVSLVWTFGLMVLVYQPGAAQDVFISLTPSLANSKGLYWIIPVLSFSVLVGLALDYDVFLMSRVADFRDRGWSDRTAMCLAVEKTSGIITTAGLIMIVSFVGMLIPQTIVLNQYGFALLVGVAIDTFAMRPIVVPAVFSIIGTGGGGSNWWPRKVPIVTRTEEEEWQEIYAGAGVDWLSPGGGAIGEVAI